MVKFGPLTVEICWRVWGTPAISTGFASWLRYYTDVAERRSTKLCTMFGRLSHWYAIYTLLEAFAPNVISSVQNSLCFQVLRSPILAALLHGTRALVWYWYKEWNYGTFADGATYIRQGGHRPTFYTVSQKRPTFGLL